MSLVTIHSATVRRIQAGDLDSLADLFVCIFPEGVQEEARHYYSHFVMPNEGTGLWVLVVDNQIVGALDIVAYNKPLKPCWSASIQYFFTKPEYEDQAWKLLKKAFRFCRANKIESCYMDVPLKDVKKWSINHHFTIEGASMKGPYTWANLT